MTPPLSAAFLGSADTTTRRAGPVDTGEEVKPTQECADSLPLTLCAVTLAAAVAASAEALLTRPPLPLLENKHADAVNAEPPPQRESRARALALSVWALCVRLQRPLTNLLLVLL